MNSSEIVTIILQTINTIFTNIFSSIDNNMYSSLDNLVFIDSSIINNSFFEKLLGANGKNGLLYLADSMLLGICLFYIVQYYYSHIVNQSVENPGHFFFKLLVFTLFVNFSYFLFEQILSINNFISSSIQSIGKSTLNIDITFSQLITKLNKNLIMQNTDFNMFSLNGLIKSFTSIELISLTFSYSVRYILLQVLILFAPFAVLSIINNSTSWIFKSWSKCLFSLLMMQIFVPIVLIVIFCIEDNNVLLVGGIYSLIKLNDYIREMFGGFGITISSNFNSALSMIKRF